MKRIILLIFCVSPVFIWSQTKNDFTQVGYEHNGGGLVDRVNVSPGGCYEMTKLHYNGTYISKSAIWHNQKIDLTQPFDKTFDVTFEISGQPADGMVFVLQNQGIDALGEHAGCIGYSDWNAPWTRAIQPSIGVEIDVYYNNDRNDIFPHHMAIMENGNTLSPLAGPVAAWSTDDDIADGLCRKWRITWDPATNELAAYYDGEQRISITKDIINETFGGVTEVWWGFTGSVGGQSSTSHICIPEVWGDASICEGESATIHVLGASGANDFNWDNAATLDDATYKSPVATPTTTTDYEVTVNNGCTPEFKDIVTVEVKPSPTSDLDPQYFICAPNGDAGNRTTVDFDAGPNGDTYDWTDPSNGNHNGQVLQNQTTPGTYEVSITLDGCTRDFTTEIVEQDLPDFDIADIIDCGDPAGFSRQVTIGTSADSYAWGDDNGAIANETNQDYTVTTNGNYQATAVLNGCAYTDQFVIDIQPDLQVDITGDDALCDGDQGQISSNIVDGDTYAWSLDGNPINGANGNSLTITTPGDYTVDIVKNGCPGTETKTIVVSPNPVPEIDQIGPFCETEFPVNITVSEQSGMAGVTYTWTNPDGSTETGASIQANEGGLYQVTANVQNCQGTDQHTIGITPPPVFDFDDPGEICPDERKTLSVIGTGLNNPTYSWSTGDNSGSVEVGAEHEGTITLTVTDNNCTDSREHTLTVLEIPTFTFQDVPSEICNDQTMTIDLSYFAGDLVWSDGSTEKIRTYVPSDANSATISVQPVHQCPTESDEHVINHLNCRCPYYVPDAFSPFGLTESNQKFGPMIDGSCDPKDYVFRVYNRWGQLVFESTSLADQWDGNYESSEAMMDVYVWTLNYTHTEGDSFEKQISDYGQVTIVR